MHQVSTQANSREDKVLIRAVNILFATSNQASRPISSDILAPCRLFKIRDALLTGVNISFGRANSSGIF